MTVSVLRMMAKIANEAGQFRYGLRGSKLAALTEYSLSVIRRAQRYLVGHGFIERVQVGGGRASTRWRIVLHKLRLLQRHCLGGSWRLSTRHRRAPGFGAPADEDDFTQEVPRTNRRTIGPSSRPK